MGLYDLIIKELVKLLLRWSFRGLGALGIYGGLITS
jgi:hypothetical protein